MQRDGSVGCVFPDERLSDGSVPVCRAVAKLCACVLDAAAGRDGAVWREPVQSALGPTCAPENVYHGLR